MKGGNIPFGGWQKGEAAKEGCINHHCKLLKKMKALYKNKNIFKSLCSIEALVNKKMREDHQRDEVERRREENGTNRRAEEDAEEWQDEGDDEGDY